MNTSYRFAREEDLPRIVEIYNSSIPSGIVTADTEAVTVDSKRNWFFSHHEKTRPLIVFESAGEIAGWLSFHSFYGRPAYHITAEIGIYIHPAFQGKGLGKAILDHAIAVAPQLGLENLLGFIFAHNHPSLKLFQQKGFKEWGDLPGVALINNQRIGLKILGKKVN